MQSRVLKAAWLVAMTCGGLFGQPAPLPSFEVASVRPVDAEDGDFTIRGGPGTRDPGLVTYRGIWLGYLIRNAYQVKWYQIDGPDWLETNKYDIVAKVPPDTTWERFWQMLQSLLAERFSLAFHHEAREFSAFALVVDKRGPKLKETEPRSNEELVTWAYRPVPRVQMARGGARITGNRQPIAGLADMLEREVDRPVVDRTGLTGSYNSVLEFESREREPAQSLLPNIFSALPKQLGVRLQPIKARLDVLVIDRVEKAPTPN